MSSAGHAVTGLSVDGFYQQTSPLIKGNDLHLDRQSLQEGNTLF